MRSISLNQRDYPTIGLQSNEKLWKRRFRWKTGGDNWQLLKRERMRRGCSDVESSGERRHFPDREAEEQLTRPSGRAREATENIPNRIVNREGGSWVTIWVEFG